MSGGAREQVARLLALVPYLNSHPEVALDRAARDFNVKPAQIVRDLKVLWYCGLPGLGPGEMIDIDMDAFEDDGDGMIRLSNADYLSRPLRLGSSEAAALVVALRAMREGSPEASREVIDRVLAKLEGATTEGAAADVVEVPEHLAVSARVGARLSDAIADDRQVRLEYYVPTRDETTERVVDPLAVLEAEGHSYLDAWCHLAEARRLFRLDRVTGLEILDQPALEHDVAPRDLSEGLFEPGPDDVLATVRLHRVARWVSEYYPVESQTELPDGGLEVTLRMGDPQWLVRLLMRLAPYAELVGPADLAARVSDEARRALAHYASDTQPGQSAR
jgi:proteasome accessory factor C